MRGNPPLHLTLALIGFMLLAIPLAKLTFARADIRNSKPVSVIENAATSGCQLRVRFAHVPKHLVMTHDGKVVFDLKKSDQKSPVEQTIRLNIPKDGVEFNVSADWPEGTPDTALTIELEPDGLDSRSVTRWSSDAQINEVVSFTW